MNKSLYFQHDYNSANDHKILFLRQQFGIEGYGIFWYIIEQLAQAGGSLPTKIIPVIAMQIQTTPDKVKAVIYNYELFNIVNEEFFSMRLKQQLEFRQQLSIDGKAGALKRWGESDGTYNRKKTLKYAQKVENHSQAEWTEMLEFFDYKCIKCGDYDVIKDHIIPLYKGGLDGINNIQPLCKRCNSAKGNDSTDYRLNFGDIPQKWTENRGASGDATTKGKERKGKKEKEMVFPSVLIASDEPYWEGILMRFKHLKPKEILTAWEGWYVNKFEWRKKELAEMRLSFETWLKDPHQRKQSVNPNPYKIQ